MIRQAHSVQQRVYCPQLRRHRMHEVKRFEKLKVQPGMALPQQISPAPSKRGGIREAAERLFRRMLP